MENEEKKELIALIISFILFVLGYVLKFTIFKHGEHYFIIENGLFILSYLCSGFDVLIGALKNIFKGELLDEIFLMSIASVAAIAVGEVPEAAAVMLFYKIGESFEDYAVDKSRDSINSLLNIKPDFAILEKDGVTTNIKPEDIKISDIIVIRPGDRIPVDSVVISGTSSIDTSSITGEFKPVDVDEGSSVLAGCINGDSLIRVKAEKEFNDSAIAKILKLVEESAEKKSKEEKFIRKFAKYYVPIVVAIAIFITLIPPIVLNEEVSKWLLRACTLLVISCPCALVVSIPLAFFSGIGAASKKGILIKGGIFLDAVHKTEAIAMDKTGTVTYGKFNIKKIIPIDKYSEDKILSLAMTAEKFVHHPIAMAISRAGESRKFSLHKVKASENIKGMGVWVDTDNGEILAGNIKLLTSKKVQGIEKLDDFQKQSSEIYVYIAHNNQLVGIIVMADISKPEVKSTVSNLRKFGVKEFYMLTGDEKESAEKVAFENGIDKVYPKLFPEEKVIYLEKIMNKYKNGKVMFVGDGTNDAPSLIRADVGISMGNMGSDSAIEASDIVIIDDNIGKLIELFKISGNTISTAKKNIIFAVTAKILLLILGLLGIANMWAAVFADVGVLIICVLNSIKLLSK